MLEDFRTDFNTQIEIERLQLQAQVWEPDTEVMLDHIGIKPGWSCLDVGCGPMGVLGSLSRRVGPSGRVVGIDTDSALLTAAQAYISQKELTNVEILECDARTAGLSHGAFDLVHERFVFPHVGSPDTLLQRMLTLARPRGIVAIQEIDLNSMNFYPLNPNWSRLKQIIEETFALCGNINTGCQAYEMMLRRFRLEDVTIRASVLALQDSHPYMRWPIIGITAMRKEIVGAGIAKEAELENLLLDIEQRISDPETVHITFTLVQVWGRKPAKFVE